MTGPFELYLRALDDVTRLVEVVSTGRWDATSPCPDWTARQLVGHLVDGQGQVVGMLTGNPRRPVLDPAELASLAGPDPREAWRRGVGETRQALAEVAPTATVSTPLGEQTVVQLLGVALIEPLVHTWDLAVATGRPARLDPEAVDVLLPGVLALGDQLQHTGMYSAPGSVPADAPAQDRLLAALGRDPRQPTVPE